jgi:Holliday junction resolvase RusA-like endonuclease
MRVITFTLPWTGKPKARPRVTKNGTFMPKDYQEWKKQVIEFLQATQYTGTITDPFMIDLLFGSETVEITITELSGFKRAKYVRADLDNLIGGVLDALQDAEIIKNDSQAVSVRADIVAR